MCRPPMPGRPRLRVRIRQAGGAKNCGVRQKQTKMDVCEYKCTGSGGRQHKFACYRRTRSHRRKKETDNVPCSASSTHHLDNPRLHILRRRITRRGDVRVRVDRNRRRNRPEDRQLAERLRGPLGRGNRGEVEGDVAPRAGAVPLLVALHFVGRSRRKLAAAEEMVSVSSFRAAHPRLLRILDGESCRIRYDAVRNLTKNITFLGFPDSLLGPSGLRCEISIRKDVAARRNAPDWYRLRPVSIRGWVTARLLAASRENKRNPKSYDNVG